MLWRAVWRTVCVLFGHQKGRLNRAAHRGWISSVGRWRPAAPLVGDKFHWGALVRGLVPCGYGGSPGPALGLDSLPCGTGMFVAISLPLVSHGNAFSDRFRASDDPESSKG